MALHGKRFLLLLAAAVLLAVPVARAGASEPAAAGVVAEYRPTFARYVVQRGKSVVPVRIGATVFAGDRVELPKDGVLIVQLADQTSRRFSGPGSFEVPAAEGASGVMAVLASIPALFESQQRRYGTAATRGSAQCGVAGVEPDPIVVPIVGDGARMAATQHELQLAWRGGCKPFRVQVLGPDGHEVLQRDALAERRVRLTGVNLPAGRSLLIVTDSTGLRFEAPLEVVANAPAMPGEIAAADGVTGDVGRGVWLANQADANWRLAAYESLRPSIEAGDALALAVGDSLLTGRAP